MAFAVYVTNENLAGTTSAAYGFRTSASGVGAATFDVGGANREAFGLEATESTVMTLLLLATDAKTRNGRLYDNGDRRIDGVERALREMANGVYTMINEGGEI